MVQGRDGRTDITEMLDYFYQDQLEELQRRRRRVSDRATDRKRVELQQAALENSKAKMAESENPAGTPGLDVELGWLRAQLDTVREAEESITQMAREMQVWVNRYRLCKESFKADYHRIMDPSSAEFPGRTAARQLPDDRLSTAAAIEKAAMLDALPLESAGASEESG